MRDHLRLLINKPVEANDAKPFKDLKLLNDACLNVDAIEAVGSSQVLSKLLDMGGWPVLSNTWNDASWSWENTIGKLRTHGYSVNHIFSFSVTTDYRNSSIRSARVLIASYQSYPSNID